MALLLFLPFLFQTIIISIDEFYFHLKRSLPQWERIGHPLDTLTVVGCFSFILFVPYSLTALKIYGALALFSCIFVTKDEFVHKECCSGSEQWLHALLFINHPIVLTSAALLWPLVDGATFFAWQSPLLFYQQEIKTFLILQTVFGSLFLLYQILYWNFLCKTPKSPLL